LESVREYHADAVWTKRMAAIAGDVRGTGTARATSYTENERVVIARGRIPFAGESQVMGRLWWRPASQPPDRSTQ